MKLSETIASNIKRLRLAQKMTQEEAAFRCDISTRYYSDVHKSKEKKRLFPHRHE